MQDLTYFRVSIISMWFPTIDDAEQDLTYFRVSIISMWFPTNDAEQDLIYF